MLRKPRSVNYDSQTTCRNSCFVNDVSTIRWVDRSCCLFVCAASCHLLSTQSLPKFRWILCDLCDHLGLGFQRNISFSGIPNSRNFFFLALLFPRKSMVPQKVSGVDCYCRIPETNKALETSSGHVRPWNKQKHAKTTRTKQPVDPAYDKSAGLRMWTCSRSLPDILAPIFNGFWLHTRNAIFVDQDLLEDTSHIHQILFALIHTSFGQHLRDKLCMPSRATACRDIFRCTNP